MTRSGSAVRRRVRGRASAGARAASLACCALLVSWACARTPPTPPALVAAHAALLRAQLGPAREQAPAQVARAEAGFASARAVCAKDPGASSCRDWCYVVERRAEQACAEADVALAQRVHQRAHLALVARRARQLGARAPVPPVAPGRKEPTDLAHRAVQGALRKNAPQARSVHVLGRGLVVRPGGGRAFSQGTDRLLPRARLALQRVAHALQDAPTGLLVVGVRADTGDTRDVARARAHAVVAHLIACGLPATQLSAQVLAARAFGPVADPADDGRSENGPGVLAALQTSSVAATSDTDPALQGDDDGERAREDEIELVWCRERDGP